MIVRSLRLQGFKKFKDRVVMFNRGLNVFCGPNEVGKTTIHQAFLSVLYGLGAKLGFTKKDFESWYDPSRCKVVLEYSHGSYTYLLERDFKQGTVTLKRFDPKEHQYTVYNEDTKGIQAFLIDQLGIESPQVFKNTVSVNQTELVVSDSLVDVSHNIEKIFTGHSSLSPEDIINNLQVMRKRFKKQRNEKPGKIDIFEEELRQVKQEVAIAQRLEEERLALEQKIENISQKIPEMKENFSTISILLEKWEQKQHAEKRLQELKKQYHTLQHQLSEYEKAKNMRDVAEKELEKYQCILAQREKIDDFNYLHKRLQEVDEHLETMMGQKITSRSVDRTQQLGSVRSTILFILAFLLCVDFIVVLYTVFVPLWNYFILSVCSGAVLLGFWLGVKFLSGGKVVVSEFNQLALERKQIVEKIQSIAQQWKCGDSNDFSSIVTQLQRLTILEDRVETANLKMQTIVGRESLDVLEEEQRNLGMEAAGVKEKLKQLADYQPDLMKIQTWEQQKRRLEQDVPEQEKELHQLQGRVEELHRERVSLSELEAHQEFLQQEIDHLEIEHQAIVVALEQFQQVIDNYHAVYIPELEKRASHYFYHITSGRYKKVDLSAWPDIKVHAGSNLGFTTPADIQQQIQQYSFGSHAVLDKENSIQPRKIKPDYLSQGTLDQLFLSLRIAATELLSKKVKLPLFFDDPFTHFDLQRLQQVLAILIQLSSEHQIIYFTHNQNVVDILEDLDTGGNAINVVTMEGL